MAEQEGKTMTETERALEALRWMLNDLEENGHYQVGLYADVVRDAVKVIEKMSDEKGH